MSCERLSLSKLVDLTVGKLAPREKTDAQEHVRRCAECQAAVADLSPLIDSREAPPDLAIGAAVDEAVMATVDAILRRTGVRRDRPSARLIPLRRRVHVRRRPPAFRQALLAWGAAAAILLVGVCFALFFGSREPRHAREGRTPRADTSRGRPVAAPSSERHLETADDGRPDAGVPLARVPRAAERRVFVEGPPHVPSPRIVPAPPEEVSRTGTSLACISAAEGAVEYARPGMRRWFRAHEGTAIKAGDRVRTTLSRARIEFESGSVLFVNRWTTLTIDEKPGPPGLSMVGGEVYVETVEEDKGFRVETPHGSAVDLGTRLGLDVGPAGTKLVVVEGRAEASTKGGKTEVRGGQEVLLARRAGPPGPVREARDVERRFAWATGGALAAGATGSVPGEILLRPKDARIAGNYWRVVKDPGASSGHALEAPPAPGDWLWPKGRNRHLTGFVEYRFRAEGGRWYRLWVRGQCIAQKSPIGSDAVCVLPVGAEFDRKCRFLSRHPGLYAYLYNGFGNRAGYWWIGGDADGGRDAVPVRVRFLRTGQQVLRLYIGESPIRIDTVWLSTSQATRPADEHMGP